MRRGYYMDADHGRPRRGAAPALHVVPPADPAPPAEPALPDKAELVRGAEAIAARLGIDVKDFYRLMTPDKRTQAKPAKGPWRRSPLGLVADGAALDAWWAKYLRNEVD